MTDKSCDNCRYGDDRNSCQGCSWEMTDSRQEGEASVITLVIPFPPVSGNHYKSINFRTRRIFVTKKGLAFRLAVKVSVLKASRDIRRLLPLNKKFSLTIQCFPPDRLRRDKDNVEKVVLDALTIAGVWDDDSLIGDKMHRDWGEPQGKGKGYVVIVIDTLEA